MTISGSGAGVADLDAAYWAGETDSFAQAIETLADGYDPDTNPWAEYEADRARALAHKVGDDPADPDDPSLAAAEATLRKTTADEDHDLEVSTAGFAETASNAAAVAQAVFELAVAGASKAAGEVQSGIVNALAAAHVYRPSLPDVPAVGEGTLPPVIDAILAGDYVIGDPWTSPDEIIAVLAADRFQVPAELAPTYTDGVAERGLLEPLAEEFETAERRAAKYLARRMDYFSVSEFESLIEAAKEGVYTHQLGKMLDTWAGKMMAATDAREWSIQVDRLVRGLRQSGFPLNRAAAFDLSKTIRNAELDRLGISTRIAFEDPGNDADRSESLRDKRERLKKNLRELLTRGVSEAAVLEFIEGVVDGFVDGLKQWMELARLVEDMQLVTSARSPGFRVLNHYTPLTLPSAIRTDVMQWWYGPEAFEQEVKDAEERILAVTQGIAEGLMNIAEVMRNYKKIAEVSSEILDALGHASRMPLFDGTLATFVHSPSMALGPFMENLIDHLGPNLVNFGLLLTEDVTPHQYGYIVGTLTYEVVETAVTLGFGAVAKAGTLPKLVLKVKKLPFLANKPKVLDKLDDIARMAGRTRAAESTLGPKGGLPHQNGIYEAVTEQGISGTTRAAHRASANRALLEAIDSDPRFARQLGDILGVDDVAAHMRSGKSGLKNPPGTAWHHPIDNPEVMQLLRREVHRHPELRNILHRGPNNSGGFGQNFGG